LSQEQAHVFLVDGLDLITEGELNGGVEGEEVGANLVEGVEGLGVVVVGGLEVLELGVEFGEVALPLPGEVGGLLGFGEVEGEFKVVLGGAIGFNLAEELSEEAVGEGTEADIP